MKMIKRSVRTRMQGFGLLGIGILSYHADAYGAALVLITIASCMICFKEV